MPRPLLVLLFAAALCCADTVNYTYDAAGRLIRADYGSGTSIAYTYDAAGNLLSRMVTTPPPAAQSARDVKPPRPKKRAVVKEDSRTAR